MSAPGSDWREARKLPGLHEIELMCSTGGGLSLCIVEIDYARVCCEGKDEEGDGEDDGR